MVLSSVGHVEGIDEEKAVIDVWFEHSSHFQGIVALFDEALIDIRSECVGISAVPFPLSHGLAVKEHDRMSGAGVGNPLQPHSEAG